MEKQQINFEVLWFIDESNYECVEFKTRRQALNFYNAHKDDADKSGWWVTERDQDGCVIEDIIA